MTETGSRDRLWLFGLVAVALVYLHNTLPYLTMLPRVNVDEPWLMERAYQVMTTGVPSQPMLGLRHAYLLQVGYGYLLALWMSIFGVDMYQARLLGVILGLGIALMTVAIGRRTIDTITGTAAALFLSTDSNFLGGVRNARTDIPSVFFVTCAFLVYLVGRQQQRIALFVASGAALGLGILCHGNAFWAGLILIAWIVLDDGRRAVMVRRACALAAGVSVTLGPYLAIVIARWDEVQVQIGNFAADRVPGWRPSFIADQMLREVERYRGWYFGLVTSLVPNPLLWTFQVATAIGIIALAVQTYRAVSIKPVDRSGPARLLILAIGGPLLFAAFINNKVPVYLPHLLVGYALAAGFAVREAASGLSAITVRRRAAMGASATAAFFLVAYSVAGVAYYEKWYRSASKSELVPYESTEATLHQLVPSGPKYVFASPQFWTPFHAERDTTFYSYAAEQPQLSSSGMTLPGTEAGRPVFLVIDEFEWLEELTGETSSPQAWRRAWIEFIERDCGLDAVAYGTAHGTIATYACGRDGRAPRARSMRIIGDSKEFVLGPIVLHQNAGELAQWRRYDDPRRTASMHPVVRVASDGLTLGGSGWPGIVTTFRATIGDAYLIRPAVERARAGDLLYIGTWQEPQVRSLSGASASGIPAPLRAVPWFPSDRAFMATSAGVRLLLYSEAPSTDVAIRSLDVYRLEPSPSSPGQVRR